MVKKPHLWLFDLAVSYCFTLLVREGTIIFVDNNYNLLKNID